jgi:hypothetical protein
MASDFVAETGRLRGCWLMGVQPSVQSGGTILPLKVKVKKDVRFFTRKNLTIPKGIVVEQQTYYRLTGVKACWT